MTLYDLHSHSIYSDGILTPTELVIRAVEKGVNVLALTDHDTLEGIPEAQKQAKISGIDIVVGTEISVTWKGRLIHIVALGVDSKNIPLQDGLKYNRSLREERSIKMARKLEKAGIENVLEGTKKYVKTGSITRTHFARFLVEKGHAKSVDDVFKKFIVPGKPGFVKMEWVDMEQAIKWIVDAGGIAVIAHPGRYKMTRAWLGRLIEDFKLWGGKGIEVAFSTANKDEVNKFAEFSKRYDLMASCGSDFHDPKNHWLELGMHKNLPQGLEPVWSKRLWKHT